MDNKKKIKKTVSDTVCRVHKFGGYAVLSNCFVRSTNLGCPAIGLLGRVMDLPPEWNFTKAGLIAVCPDGETAVESALADLEEWGYLQKIVQMPNESPTGRIRTVYNFYEYSEKDHSIPRYDYELETYTVDNATLNRVKKVGNYSMISSKLLRNREIKNKLLGFLLKVLSLPNYWNFSMSGLTAICKEGRTAVHNAVGKLMDMGYLVRTKLLPNESIHNCFEYTIKFQLTFENQNRSKEKLIKTVQIPEQADDFNNIRKEYSAMLTDKLLKGSNGQSARKFLTFGIESTSYKAARAKLMSIKNDIIKGFKAFGIEAEMLDGKSRLEALYYALNPYRNSPFMFDWDSMLKAGMDTKDFICPPSLKFNKADFEIGNAYGAVWGMNILAGELPDEILRDFLEMQNLFCVNIHAQPLEQIDALKFVKKKLTAVNAMKVDEQKKASQSGYDPDILPPAIKMYIEDIENLLADLNSKNERLFHISISIRSYAKSKKELKLQSEMLKRICQKNNCTIFSYDYRQEQTFVSTLPLCYDEIPVCREMHTSGIAIFVPFTTKELFQDGQATYYGVNTLSGNMIRANRSRLKNPNELILGTPGSGKSFSVKREILDCFLTTIDDIIICDPEGEYFPLVLALHGQLIRIASNSEQHINPMDISIDDYLFENPMEVIANKSDFLISLCEIIVGGRYGLSSEERSVIDKCVQRLYKNFIENEPTADKMPLLSDLQHELQKEGEVALRVSNSLEMFVNGSQNIFNHRTNIDLSNRLICFDIKELGNQLKKVGMLIVQDTVWIRVSANREKKKITRYYIDEFHLLLKEEQTAKYSAEIWKRFRKWGGVPTGITQNVKDLLSSAEVENIFDNSDFVYMLNQAAGDRDILAEKLHISKEQMKYVTNSGAGEGLIRYDKVLLPFTDHFPQNTEMFKEALNGFIRCKN